MRPKPIELARLRLAPRLEAPAIGGDTRDEGIRHDRKANHVHATCDHWCAQGRERTMRANRRVARHRHATRHGCACQLSRHLRTRATAPTRLRAARRGRRNVRVRMQRGLAQPPRQETHVGSRVDVVIVPGSCASSAPSSRYRQSAGSSCRRRSRPRRRSGPACSATLPLAKTSRLVSGSHGGQLPQQGSDAASTK